MSGINGLYVASNPTALTAQYSLTRNMGELSTTLTRLSTGLRINSAKDDPAGLIASELLKSDIAGTSAAITNVQRANGVLSTADSGMANIGNLLTDIKSLVVEAANSGAMNADQIAANQLQVNATLEAIDQIATSTTYGGKNVLDGSLDFTTNSTSGGVSDLTVYSANFGTASSLNVNVDVKEAAKRGTLIYNGNGVSQKTTLDITGSTGTKSLTFGKGATNAEMAEAINAVSDSTGVQARVEGVAQRGTAILSSAGANNDILITANEEGFDAGNYTFRITQGPTNDARIVSDPAGTTPGVVEISLAGSTETAFTDFANLFDITIDATYDGTGAAGDTSVNMTRGNSNKVQFFTEDSAANGVSKSSGVAVTIGDTSLAGADVRMSDFNGWTVKIDSTKAGEGNVATHTVDQDNKTVYLAAGSATGAGLATAFEDALGATGTLAAADFVISGGTLAEGDSLTLGNGGTAGELFVQYKAGATADEIMKMINNAPNVQATLASGVKGSDVISNLPSGSMHATKAAADAVTNKYVSGATSQEVIDLINSKLGDLFTASALNGDGTGGRVSYMDAAVDYGDVNLDNALRFTGMDNGPLVRLSNLKPDGTKATNQELSVEIIQPTDEDIRNGVTTPILQINLATDASGNSITTAKDIADLFDRLTPAQTLGVSAEVVYPPGVDPNGGTWVTDNCGNTIYTEGCGATYGLGIVPPTGVEGPCGAEQNDLVLLGANQELVKSNAFAKITSDTTVAGVAAVATDSGGTATLTFGTTSALNGVNFNFTLDETKEGFDEETGTLTVFINANLRSTADGTAGAMSGLINDAVAANWESIRAYTNSTLESPGAAEQGTIDKGYDDLTDLIDTGATIGIPKSTGNATDDAGTLGVTAGDSAMTITAKDKGTDMAGVKIYFVQDDTMAAWAGAGSTMELSVGYKELENGEKQLIIKGNMGTATSINGVDLANSLNNNDAFKKLFEASATLADLPADADTPPAAADAAGAVTFRPMNTNNPNGVTEGGYRVDSSVTGKAGTGTSTGISMTGGTDSNERLVLEATDVGSENFVKVVAREGSFDTYCPLGLKMNELAGTDAVVTVNGLAANARGNNITLNTADLSLSFTSDGKIGSSSFSIDGGGALFQIGPNVVSAQQKRVGIASMMTTAIGGASGKLFQLKSGGTADLEVSDESRKLADKIINESISYVANARGRLGAVQSSLLAPMQTVLEDQLVALTEAEASISNADFAEESSKLTQLQLLIQSGMSTLGIANQLPQYAASLVR